LTCECLHCLNFQQQQQQQQQPFDSIGPATTLQNNRRVRRTAVAGEYRHYVCFALLWICSFQIEAHD
jgi:hypothetical protein